MRMVAGLEEVTRGSILIGDEECHRPAAAETKCEHDLSELCRLAAYDGL